ncbi:MAG: hypothetical protein HY593_06045 [Candidatus Omnitrophica bacterium]|nr:hypothetical protein [Candidatus Omnitrophota bacterium]
MREIFIKTSTSDNHKRKNLSIVEVINQNGIIAKAEKRYSYYVAEQSPFQDTENLQQVFQGEPFAPTRKDRHVSIKKIFDRKSGIGQMIYRVIGSFYVVQNLHLFAVVFMHSIRFDLFPDALAKHKF